MIEKIQKSNHFFGLRSMPGQPGLVISLRYWDLVQLPKTKQMAMTNYS